MASTWLNDTEILYSTSRVQIGRFDISNMRERPSNIALLRPPGVASINEILNERPNLECIAIETEDDESPHKSEIWDMCLNPSGRLLALNAANDDSVGIYDMPIMTPLAITNKNQRAEIFANNVQLLNSALKLCWWSDAILATGCADGHVRVYQFDRDILKEQRRNLLNDNANFCREDSFIGSCHLSRERYSRDYAVVLPQRNVFTGENYELVGLEHDPVTNSLLSMNESGYFGTVSDTGVAVSSTCNYSPGNYTCMKFFKEFRIALVGMLSRFSIIDPRIKNGMSVVSTCNSRCLVEHVLASFDIQKWCDQCLCYLTLLKS